MRTHSFSRRRQPRPINRRRFGLERFEPRAVLAAVDTAFPEMIPDPPGYSLGAQLPEAFTVESTLFMAEMEPTQSQPMSLQPTLLQSTSLQPTLLQPSSVHLAHRSAFSTRFITVSGAGNSDAASSSSTRSMDAEAESMNAATIDSLVLAISRALGGNKVDAGGSGSASSTAMPLGLLNALAVSNSAGVVDWRQYAGLMAMAHSGHGAGTTVVAASESAVASGHHGEATSGVAVVAVADNHSDHSSSSAPAFASAATVVAGEGEMSTWERRDANGSGGSQGGLAHHGGVASAKGVGGVELAKKWCTTTPLANRLVTTLEGKPTCDCKETPPREGIAKYLPAVAGGVSKFDSGAASTMAGWNALSDGKCRWTEAAEDAILGWSADHICSSRPVDQAIASLTAALRNSTANRGTPTDGTIARSSDVTAVDALHGGEDGMVESLGLPSWTERLDWLGTALVVAGVYLAPWIMKREETEADRRAAEDHARNRWQVELL
ncbi:MAG: hypothetical protein ACKO38_17495 [Planctomycetota bacterium]